MVAGIDVGGSGTKACLVTSGRIEAVVVLPTDLSTQPNVGDLVLAALDKALAEAGSELAALTAIGVGIPGEIGSGWVRNAANLGIGSNGFDLGGHVDMGTGIRCACGSVGCLETVIGAEGLRDAWDGSPIASLFQSAEQGDDRAAEAADRAIDHLARAMWWLAAAYDPDLSDTSSEGCSPAR